jgi:hypothetical protein
MARCAASQSASEPIPQARLACRNKEPRRSGARTILEGIKMKTCASDTQIAAVLRQLRTPLPKRHSRILSHRSREPSAARRVALAADWASPRPFRTPSTWPRLSQPDGRGLLSAPRAERSPRAPAAFTEDDQPAYLRARPSCSCCLSFVRMNLSSDKSCSSQVHECVGPQDNGSCRV